LLNCPQEGKGRDATALTKANVASAKAYARSYDRPPRFPGQLDQETAEPISSVTGNFLLEDGTPLLFEDSVYMTLEG
jgi:hypothetical protein